ncbi:hypothetical protein CHARACLAT_026034 [Characodon lateralis]|uniref:MHC class I antigen n=1 Tax=Characodon lateralis TaxID=208331 RepID=A0ABU7E3K4_9TELE|nr:hypothetical protein [Characodon lateralis]
MRVFRISCAGCEFSTRGGGRETREERGGRQIPTPQRAARLREISSAFHQRAKSNWTCARNLDVISPS